MSQDIYRECSIRDSRMSADARKLVRGILHAFADEVLAGYTLMSRKEKRKSAIRLFELGFLMIADDGDGFVVTQCMPEEAPQLRGALSFEKSLNMN